MISKEENELLCRMGPGMPMGELFRRFWLPGLSRMSGRRISERRRSNNFRIKAS